METKTSTLMTEAEAKTCDEILKHLISIWPHKHLSIQQCNNLFPKLSSTEIRHLYNLILEYKPQVAIEHTFGEGGLSATDYASKFLEDGGFETAWQKQFEANKQREERQRKQDQVLDLTIDNLVDKILDQPKVKNRLLRSEIISGASALAAILTVILSAKGC